MYNRVWVHPRMRGEYTAIPFLVATVCGSPPRVRGIQESVDQKTGYYRFTPACAGNTMRSPVFYSAYPVHPRVCGEYGNAATKMRPLSGSPPRVRGIPILGKLLAHDLRFTPACAGNTFPGRWMPSVFRVHPRVCGEYIR